MICNNFHLAPSWSYLMLSAYVLVSKASSLGDINELSNRLGAFFGVESRMTLAFSPSSQDKVIDFCSGGCADFGRTVTLQHYHPDIVLPPAEEDPRSRRHHHAVAAKPSELDRVVRSHWVEGFHGNMTDLPSILPVRAQHRVLVESSMRYCALSGPFTTLQSAFIALLSRASIADAVNWAWRCVKFLTGDASNPLSMGALPFLPMLQVSPVTVS